MIKIDASSIIPKRLGTYLLGIIPGLLFELSIAFGDPLLARPLIERARQVYPFQPYALLILFAASCLVVGQTFFLLSWFTEMLVSLAYGLKGYLIRYVFGSDWLYRVFGRLQGIPPRRNVLVRSLSRMVAWGRKRRFPFEIRPILKCQRLAATQLLNRKYGIDPSKGPWVWVDLEWQVWLLVLGKQPTAFREAALAMRTLLGCGLAGLGALYVSPALRNRYFVILTAVFIAAGCIQSLDFARRKYEPIRSSFTRLVSLLAELSEINAATKKEEENIPSKGSNLTIETDTKGDS